jgi:type IV fimbrial biogenesis protein FimT
MRLPRKIRVLGFTLVELTVSLTVMAILATTAAPSFIDFLDRNRLRGAADDVASLISNARAAAVKHDLDVSIAMRGLGAAWCIGANAATPPSGGLPAGAAVPCNCITPTDPNECLVGGQRFAVDVGAHPDVRVGALPAPLTFDGTLGVVSPLGARSVVLTSPRGTYDVEIRVNPLGQAFLCIPDGKPGIAGTPSC